MRVSVFRIARGRHRLWDQAIQYPPVIQLITAAEYSFGLCSRKGSRSRRRCLALRLPLGPGTYFKNELSPKPRVRVDEAAARSLPALVAPTGVLSIVD
jgi:hypothetical protein